MVGASAGVYAILTANLANMILNWHDLLLIDKIIRMFAFLAFVGCDLGVTFTHKELTIVAHLGGALAGLLLGVIILKDWHLSRPELICQLVSAFFFIVMALTCMSLMIIDRQKHGALVDSASSKIDRLVKTLKSD